MLQVAAKIIDDTQATDVQSYIAAQQNKTFLRFLTCGSVDDGKSTLIGRLLYDTKLVFEDQLQTLQHDSLKHGTNGSDLDFALLVDGLEAEREQGITIDVAYRFFATAKRKFIVADTPGHEQYTRNMATGASTADLAVVLVNAKAGLLQQTRRHTIIASLLGIRHIVLAVNKIDLVGFDQHAFEAISEEYQTFAESLGFASIQPIPMSARFGDNVTTRSPNMTWYEGPSLLEYLETVEVEEPVRNQPFRFPVQYVNRPNADFRGFAGTIASGSIAVGDEVLIPSPRSMARIRRIVTHDGDLETASRGQAVTLVLDREIDISRGSILSSPERKPHVADQFAANVVWFNESPLVPGRMYLLRTETDQVSAKVSQLKHRVNINNFAHEAAKSLEMNEAGVCDFSLQAQITFDAFADNKATGSFILIDRMTNATVGAGMFLHPLRRAANIHWQKLDVNKAARAEQKQQTPSILWFTGLSGSGKSTIANLLERKFHAAGRHTYILDGDNVRHGLNRDLGFKQEDRVENIRRVAEVAKLMADAGLIVLVSLISPFRAERQMARELVERHEFIEIFIDTPLEECIERDPKGLYAKALKDEIKNFTGIDSPYEQPETPDVRLNTSGRSPEELVVELEDWLRERNYC